MTPRPDATQPSGISFADDSLPPRGDSTNIRQHRPNLAASGKSMRDAADKAAKLGYLKPSVFDRKETDEDILLQKFTNTVTTSPPNSSLSESASSSLKDFKFTLKCIGKDVLDEEGFHRLLDDMGYKRSRDGLFESLLEDISRATGPGDVSKTEISVDDLAKLYASESYHLLDCGKDSGDALMAYADEMFTDANTDGSGELDADECRRLVDKLVGKDQSEEELEEVFKAFDADGNGLVSRCEFKEAILKVNRNVDSGLPPMFNYNLLLPTHTSPEQFVSKLERFAKSHRGVNHPLLENITSGAYGPKVASELILVLLSAYSQYTKTFSGSVLKLMSILDSETEKEILEQNLDEEMGNYDEETLRKVQKLGISPESIDKIPHKELYMTLIRNVEKKLKKSVIDFLPDSMCASLIDAKAYAVSQGVIGLLSFLYFGSELIVPTIYASLLVGLRESCDISNQEAAFLILHIGMDCDHADQLRKIVMSHCYSHDERRKFALCTERVLSARNDFFDAVLAYSTSEEVQTSVLYNKQATKWCRVKPRCLSDFTGRPVVYDMMSEHVQEKTILDVGCGEGFVARKLIELGAAKVVGVDVSPGMIGAALASPNKSPNEHYLVGDSAHLKQSIVSNSSDLNVMLGAQLDVGTFGSSVAVFLFNYVFKRVFMHTLRTFSKLNDGRI